jgi:site-specific DNA recombinase
MTKCFLYLRTSGDDGKKKAGIPVQRDACTAFAASHQFKIVKEFADDGITGKLPMHARPQGKLLMAALLADGVKHVLCYDAKRIGRTQPAFWSFIGMCRDNGITVLDASGTDLGGSVMGGVNGMLAEMDRDATVARLTAGKLRAKAEGKRVDGRFAYGEHPALEFAGERAIVERIRKMHAQGGTLYGIAKQLNAEGIRTRTNAEFKPQTISRIIDRR